MAATVAWIAYTPVKGLRLQHRDEAQVTEAGIPGDRAFFIVDERGAVVSATRIRPLVAVLGDFSAALTDHCGNGRLRLFASPSQRGGLDRGRIGAVTLLSVASLQRLREQAGEAEAVDPRRFRMTFGVEGLDPHQEDSWLGREVKVGDAVVEVAGNVGRCALTTRQPDTGVVDFKTLHHLRAYRDDVPTTEPLPFGVHARVVHPGRVRVGDAVELV